MTDPLVSPRFPYLLLRLRLGSLAIDLTALLDTGFDGHLAVPPDLIPDQLAPDYHLQWALADGSEVLAPAYLGTVNLGSFPLVEAIVTTLGDESLLGRGVSDRFLIILDHGQQLVVEE